ncbi:hypothetical protein LZ32DRAFT_546273, partial [Colletotrichum eremochloae]
NSLYSTGDYSDLTISSGAKRYPVHRAIVCPRSEFLAAACRSPFKVPTSLSPYDIIIANVGYRAGSVRWRYLPSR